MKRSNFIITIISTVIFAILFYKKSLGLNVAIYGITTAALLAVFKPGFLKPTMNKLVLIGFALSSIAFGMYGSPMAFLLSLLSLLMLFGLHSLIPIRNILFSLPNFFSTYFKSWTDFFQSIGENAKFRGANSIWRIGRITLIPLLIVIIFIGLYSLGSTFFGSIVNDLISRISKQFELLFSNFNVILMLVLILGLFFAVIHSLKPFDTWFAKSDSEYTDNLTRIRKKMSVLQNKLLDLKYEYKSAVFLFSALNLLLLMLLIVEINNVWFGFKWEGEFLKPFVHEGTIALIFTILLSIVLTAYFFRRNLNFYSKNKLLVVLSQVWIGLNAVLVLSVAIRNYHYIQHFALAYKRIGVYFFLLLCLIGLMLLWYKIVKKKSSYYLIRMNAIVAYLGLVILGLMNWDVFIAKYNFSHSKTAFVHLDFMKRLSDKALPYLDLSDAEKKKIEQEQIEAVPFYNPGYFEETNYSKHINRRKKKFLKQTESKSFLEISLADAKAFQLLSNASSKAQD